MIVKNPDPNRFYEQSNQLEETSFHFCLISNRVTQIHCLNSNESIYGTRVDIMI